MVLKAIQNGFKYKAMRAAAVLVLAMVVFILLIVLRPKAERQIKSDSSVLVEVLPAKAEDVHMLIETYGTVKPRETLKLVAEVRGQIVDMHASFKEGSFVRKGTVLMKIDPRTYQLEVERRSVQVIQTEAEFKRLQQEIQNLEASLKIAKSDADLAQNELLRLKKLISKNVVAQTTLEKAEQKYLASLDRVQGIENQLALTGPLKERLEAQRDMDKVMLRQAQLDLERAAIIAPFDGWVLAKVVEEGQHVNTAQYLGDIYATGALDVEARIPVNDLKWLPTGLNAEKMPEADIVFNLAESRHTWKGRVARTKAQMDEKTRTLAVVVEVDENDARDEQAGRMPLRPGMFVTVNIKGIKVSLAFVLPRHVVHEDDVVFIVQQDRLKIRPVVVLRRFKDTVFVVQGLEDGELIVQTPLSNAVDGMQVRVKKAVESQKTESGSLKTL